MHTKCGIGCFPQFSNERETSRLIWRHCDNRTCLIYHTAANTAANETRWFECVYMRACVRKCVYHRVRPVNGTGQSPTIRRRHNDVIRRYRFLFQYFSFLLLLTLPSFCTVCAFFGAVFFFLFESSLFLPFVRWCARTHNVAQFADSTHNLLVFVPS